ncbi:MAG: glycosyltransferase [Pirellulales bacterium]
MPSPGPRTITEDLSIAFLSPSLSREAGGIFEVERQLALHLAGLPGVRIEAYGTRDAGFVEDAPLWKPVDVQSYPYYGPPQFRWSPGLMRSFSECRADVAHLHWLWMHTSIIMRNWSSRHRRPFVTTLHGMLDDWALRNSRWRKIVAAWAYERDCLAKAACIHALSAQEVNSARAFGLKNPICVIPNGVELPSNVAAGPPWSETATRGRRVLLYLGRLHPKKGLVNLLKAWSKLTSGGHRAADEWCLVIAGWEQGGHESELKSVAVGLGIDHDVLFTGPKFGTDKAAAFAHADAFILPSFSEGLPMVVLEAWSYGKPVLMTRHCNLLEGFAAEAALVIEPHEQSIAEQLQQLMAASAADRNEMGARGRELVTKQFTWPSLAARMHAVYQWLVGGGDPPECVVIG